MWEDYHSVKRRSFVAMASAVAIAGCSGGRVDELESQLTEREEELQTVRGRLNETEAELEQVNGALESVEIELNETEAEVEDVESELRDAETTLDEVRSELTAQETATADAKRREVVRFYGFAITLQNAAVDNYNNAISALDNEEYVESSARFGSAFSGYDSSSILFNTAEGLASDLDEVTAQEYCATGERAMELMADACEQYQIGTQQLANREDGSSSIETGDQFYNNRQDLIIERRATIESELGVEIQADNRA